MMLKNLLVLIEFEVLHLYGVWMLVSLLIVIIPLIIKEISKQNDLHNHKISLLKNQFNTLYQHHLADDFAEADFNRKNQQLFENLALVKSQYLGLKLFFYSKNSQ